MMTCCAYVLQVEVVVPSELLFKLKRLCVLHSLEKSDVPEAQRLTATLLAPLVESNTSLRPLLQQTMQWFLQTDQSAVRAALLNEVSDSMQALSSHFSGLLRPEKRAAPDPIVGPVPPQPMSLCNDTDAGAKLTVPSGAGPSTSTSEFVLDRPKQGGAARLPTEDAATAAVRQSRLVNLLQAGVFVYASWYRRSPIRRRAAVADPCGSVLGIHSLLHGGIDAAMSAIQELEGGERSAGPDGSGGATRARMLAQVVGAIVPALSIIVHLVAP
jgi:hypothetical protein